MDFAEFSSSVRSLVSTDARAPLFVYSELFSIARAFPVTARELPQPLIASLRSALGEDRTLVMPVYTNGFGPDGKIDLDHAPGNTGVINETFRKLPGTVRSASAFFSVAAQGPEAAHVERLMPEDVWGKGSVFDWALSTNAHVLMIGAHWDTCSLKHGAEWLARVPYRYFKTFRGTAIRNGQEFPLEERLFVRSLAPEALNVWHGLEEILAEAGMKRLPLGGGQLAHVRTAPLIEAMLKRLGKDPYAFVAEADLLRRHFG